MGPGGVLPDGCYRLGVFVEGKKSRSTLSALLFRIYKCVIIPRVFPVLKREAIGFVGKGKKTGTFRKQYMTNDVFNVDMQIQDDFTYRLSLNELQNQASCK